MQEKKQDKKVYSPPSLRVLGDMAELTQTNQAVNLQDALGLPPPVTGSNF